MPEFLIVVKSRPYIIQDDDKHPVKFQKFMWLMAALPLQFPHQSRYISQPVATILPFLQHNRSPGEHLFLHLHTCLYTQTPQQSVTPHAQVLLLRGREALHKLHLSQKHLIIFRNVPLCKDTTVGTYINYIRKPKKTNKLINVLRKLSAELFICYIGIREKENNLVLWSHEKKQTSKQQCQVKQLITLTRT